MIRITLTFLSLALLACGQAGVAFYADPNDPGVPVTQNGIEQAATGAVTVTTTVPHNIVTGQMVMIPGVEQPCDPISQQGSLRANRLNATQFTVEVQTAANVFSAAAARCAWPGAGTSNTHFQIFYNGGVFEAKEVYQLVAGPGRGFKVGGISQSQIPLDATVRIKWGPRVVDPNHGNKQWFCGNVEDIDLIAKRDFGDGSLYFELPGATGTFPYERSVQCDVYYMHASWRQIRVFRTVQVTVGKPISDSTVARFTARSAWNAYSTLKSFITPFVDALNAAADRRVWIGVNGRGTGGTEEEYLPVMMAAFWRAEGITSFRTAIRSWLNDVDAMGGTGVFYQANSTSGGFEGSNSDWDKDKRARYPLLAFSLASSELSAGERQTFADKYLNAPEFGPCTNPLTIRGLVTRSGSVFTRVSGSDDLTTWAQPGDLIVTERQAGVDSSMASNSTFLWVNDRTIASVTASTITAGPGYNNSGNTDNAGTMRAAIIRKWQTGDCGILHRIKFAQGSEFFEAGVSRAGYDLTGNLTGTSLAQEMLVGLTLCPIDPRGCRVLERAAGRWAYVTLPWMKRTQNPFVTQYGSGYYLSRLMDLISVVLMANEAGVDLVGTDRAWLQRWASEIITLYPGNPNRRMRSIGDEPGLRGHLDFHSHGWRFFWLEGLLRALNMPERGIHNAMLYGDSFKDLDGTTSWQFVSNASKQTMLVHLLYSDPSDTQTLTSSLPTLGVAAESTSSAQMGFTARTGYVATDAVVTLWAGNVINDHFCCGGPPGFGGFQLVRGSWTLSAPGAGTSTNTTTCETGGGDASRVCWSGRDNDVQTGTETANNHSTRIVARKQVADGAYAAVDLSSIRPSGRHWRHQLIRRGTGGKSYLLTYDDVFLTAPAPVQVRVAHTNAGGTGQGPQLEFNASTALMRSAAPSESGIATKVLALDGQPLRFFRPGAYNGIAVACPGTSACDSVSSAETLRVDALGDTNPTVSTTVLTATGGWRAVEIDGDHAVATNPGAPAADGSLTTTAATKLSLLNVAPGIYTVSRNGTPFATGTRVEIGENFLVANAPGAGAISWAATQLFTVAIDQQSLPAAEVGAAYSQTITTTGGTAPIALSLTSGNLPPGLTFTSGVISGTPTTAGTYNFTLTATDANSEVGNQALSITVAAAIAITDTSLPNGTINQAISLTLSRTGGNSPYAWSSLGGPSGITVSSGGLVAGNRPATAGFYTVPISLSSGSGGSTSRNFSLLVTGPLAWRYQPSPRANGVDWSGRGRDCLLQVYMDSGRTTLVSQVAGRQLALVGLNAATTYWYRGSCDTVAITEDVLTTPGSSSTTRTAVLRVKHTGTVDVLEGPFGGTLTSRSVNCTDPCAVTFTANDNRVWSFRYRVAGAWSAVRSF
jgi:hypothetical protein